MDHANDTPVTCGDALADFHASYGKIHHFIVLALCLAGSVGNLANMAVLTHRRMRTPINAIFTALATAHLLYLLGHTPRALVGSFLPPSSTYRWTLYEVVESHAREVLWLVSTLLTLTLVTWGTIHVALPHKRRACTMRRAIVASLCACVVSTLVCVPFFLCYTVVAASDESGVTRIYRWELTDLATSQDYLLLTITSWLYGVLLTVSWLALAVITALLMHASKRRTREEATAFLMTAGDESDAVSLDATAPTPTKLLLVMSLLFLLLKLPDVILIILFVALDTSEHIIDCHMRLYELLLMASFIYPAATCCLYCAMRGEYWATLVLMVEPGRGHAAHGGASYPTDVVQQPRNSSRTSLTKA